MPFTSLPSTIPRAPLGLAAEPTSLVPCHRARGRIPFPARRRGIRAAASTVESLPAKTAPARPLYLGLDFGTSGARAAVIDDDGRLVQDVKCGYGEGADADWPAAWKRVLFELIGSLDPDIRSEVVSLAFDGTSGTALLVDPRDGAPLAPPKLYNEAQEGRAVEAAKAIAPAAHTATAPSSTLCKLLSWWLEEESNEDCEEVHNLAAFKGGSGGEGGGGCRGGGSSGWRRTAASRGLTTLGPTVNDSDRSNRSSNQGGSAAGSGCKGGEGTDPRVLATTGRGPYPLLLHQADWLAGLLYGMCDPYGNAGVSDWNNALKLGYDPASESYPGWLATQPFSPLLPPRVVSPGAPVAPLAPSAAARCGLRPDCLVCGGTTDSIAAFLAAGVTQAGQAVTSLGSTLAVKLLSTTRVDDAAYGVYSHRLGDVWLVGGASNSGGAVLRRFFTDQQLRDLTPALNPDRPTGLDYYPLPGPGERFPVADTGLQPRMSPRPKDDAVFLQGLLEGIAQIESDAYHRLAQLGASPLKEVLTAGGGAANPKWSLIRQRLLGVPLRAAEYGEACYGTALLARQGARKAASESLPRGQ
ncbi:hypothetical protein Agub_g12343 [Astrephomene gubernaculifera]|uniref:D-ribulose kinase n=1 Tax=Astrephomene gubernaculifera TaxID=47775 RepID=A0AAD3E2J9_9CHLO|nr:hypothetical protein Agub_g12343 [Astrephomene gubernaculifera]